MRRVAALAAVITAVIAGSAAVPASVSAAPAPLGPARVVLQTNAGDIVLGLFPSVAPKTVAHVLDLARSGAFDGADFFRVVPGFVAQLDVDQRSSSLPLSARSIAAQTVPLEVAPGLRHHRGVLSMAHYDGKPDSGGSSFSVLLGDAPNLDGKYTIFGDVEEGMDVVDEIASVPLSGSKPVATVVITHALVTDAAGVSRLSLRGPIPIGAGSSAGPVSTWPRLLLSTSMGDILVTLSPRDAPEHVKLLEALAGSGAYNGAFVGRADPGAYVQVFASGSPASATVLPVERGTVGNVSGALSIDSTDREQAPALTLLLSDDHALDSRYTAVGWVTEGSDVLDAMARVATVADHRPRETISVTKVSVVPAGAGTVVLHGLADSAPSSSTGTPWASFGFLVAAALLGFLIFVFSARLTQALTASAGLLVVALAFLGLWVGLVPHAAASSQWLGVALFGGAVALFRLMGRFERGRPVPPPAGPPPTAEPDDADAGAAATAAPEAVAVGAGAPLTG